MADNDLSVSKMKFRHRHMGKIALFLILLSILAPFMYYVMHPFFLLIFLLITYSLAPIAIIVYSSYLIRKNNSSELYLFYWLYFISVYVSMIAFYYMNEILTSQGASFHVTRISNIESDNWIVNSIKLYIEFSSDAIKEAKLVILIIGLVIVPQILSFVFAGIFGCGRRPILVQSISKFGTLYMAKFICVLAAINLSIFLYSLMKGDVSFDAIFDIERHPIFAPIIALWMLSASFAMLLAYCRSDEFFIYVSTNFFRNRWANIINYMTRYDK